MGGISAAQQRANSAPFYFNLDTAAFDQLTRQTEFRWASQERLTRRPAQQSPRLGEERISLKGAIFPIWRGGLAQLDTLRAIGAQLQPLNLTTGYGQVLGLWCLARLEEEQGALLRGGIPRSPSPWSSSAMAKTCRTSDGDILDTLCHHYYGHLNGTVDAVLNANPGLALEPQPFRAGLLITLPDVADSSIQNLRLWD